MKYAWINLGGDYGGGWVSWGRIAVGQASGVNLSATGDQVIMSSSRISMATAKQITWLFMPMAPWTHG